MRFLVVLACWVALCQGQTDNDLTDRVTCNVKSEDGFCDEIDYTNYTATPNWRNGTEDRKIEAELSSYIILYSSGCSNALVHLLCAYYKPPCFLPNVRLAPCRELCLYVRSTCEPTIMEYNATSTWPDHLNCDQFPPSTEGACFPGFADLDMYQNRLELPLIRGAARPPTVEKADRFWAPEEVTTSPTTPTPCPDGSCPPVEPCPNGLRPGNMSGDYQDCAIYDGSLCNSVFGRANITVPSSITNISAFIAAQDISIGTTMEQFSPVVDQDCLNYGLFIACVGLYLPCPGSAWCGANSRDELRSAVSSACRCNRADSCVVNLNNGSMVTAEDGLIALINRTIPNYYVGSSSTGPVGDSNAVCQDVT